MDPLALLGRKDKWFLGGGSGAIYAPPFPRFITAPGFWDECYFADIRLPRLFTVHFLDPQDRPIRFDSYVKGWRPDRLTVMHYAGDIVIRERRCVTSENAWVAEFELVTAVDPITVVLYSILPHAATMEGAPWQSFDDVEVGPECVSAIWRTAWPHEVSTDRTGIDAESLLGSGAMRAPTSVHLAFGCSHPRQSVSVETAQPHDDSPRWEITVLPELMRQGRLPNVVAPVIDGFVHVAQQFVLEDRKPLICACQAATTAEAARDRLTHAVRDDVINQSAADWRAAFAAVPQFESSDPFLTNAYWNRWYGLRLNTVSAPGIPMAAASGSPTFASYVTEGVGFFRNFITYSAQAHLREVSWMHSPDLGSGIVQNLAAVQRADGSLPGHTYSNRPPRDFYHADFATGIQQLEAIHGLEFDRAWLHRYADYLERRSVDGWVQVYDQNETGQEYMSRYTEVLATADQWDSFSVGGVDATTYYALLCDMIARPNQAREALSTGFGDAFYGDMKRDTTVSRARPATGFYPFLLDAFGDTSAIDRWLLNPEGFWLPAGFPATAKSDPTFDRHAQWKGRRMNCPWNGRAWPMVNSHLVDLLAKVARTSRPDLRERAAAGLMKFVKLMFHDGNPHRPSSFEHYDPVDGTPSSYRGFDDYMHSWLVDLILRHAVGVVPGQTVVDPLPLDVDWIHCEQVPTPVGFLNVHIHGNKITSSVESTG